MTIAITLAGVAEAVKILLIFLIWLELASKRKPTLKDLIETTGPNGPIIMAAPKKEGTNYI